MNLYAVRYCEIRVVIYTLSKLFGSECFRKKLLLNLTLFDRNTEILHQESK